MAVGRALITRGDVHLVRLDPTLGSEIRQTRPCLVVSPDELNHHLRTVIVAPMTTGGHEYPWRVGCRFQNRAGFVALDGHFSLSSSPRANAVPLHEKGPRAGGLPH